MSTRSPSNTVAPPSSSDTQTASSRSAGAGESSGARKDGQLTPDGRFRWSAGWDRWVPTGKGDSHDLPGPLEWGPLLPDKLHPRGCWCPRCWEAGIRYGDYLKEKKLRDL